MSLLKKNILNKILKNQDETHIINELQEQLELLKENFVYTQQLASFGSWTHDLQRNTIFWSHGIYNILESNSEEMKNNVEDFYKYIHQDDIDKVIQCAKYAREGREYNIEYRIITSTGKEKILQERPRILYDENKSPIKIIGIIQDVTNQKSLENNLMEFDEAQVVGTLGKLEDIIEIKKLQEKIDFKQRELIEMEKQMDHINTYDKLTGLPNDGHFWEKLRLQSQYARENKTTFALMMLDIDGLKYIKYSLGYEIGNLLILEIVEKLKAYLGEETFISRYSEDHFAIIVQGRNELGGYETIANEIIDLFNRSYKIQNYELNINANIGICVFPKDGNDMESLSKYSKAALLQAKQKGKNIYKFYCSDLDIKNYKELVLRSDLNNALKKEQLSINYQPMINLKSNDILGAEALLTWEHPHWGIVSPKEFIHLGEETGLIMEIEKWVLRQVCKDYKDWLREKLSAIKVSVNFSGIHFLEKNFTKNIKHIIDEFQLDPSFLIVVIKESVLIKNTDKIINNLQILQSYGIQIAIDDLGTGFASLSYLSNFNIDILKLDKSFIKNIACDDISAAIAKSMINLAKELKIKLVAEGIENFDQLCFLKDLNCYTGQGYIFCEPVPLNEFKEVLAKKKCRSALFNGISTSPRQERRDFFRIKLFQLLEGELAILELRGKKVNIGSTKVLIKDIGPGGLCFISNIKFPKEKDIVLQLTTNLLGKEMKLYGHLVWAEEINCKLHEYRVQLTIDENKRMDLIRVLNEVQIKMRKNTLFPEGNFISGTYAQYFKD